MQLSSRRGDTARVSHIYEEPAQKIAGDSAAPTHVIDEIRGEVRIRRLAGALIGTAGVAVVVGVVLYASVKINDAMDPAQYPSGASYLCVVAMAAHALISLGAVWFGYQMLRAAERMFVPRRFLHDAKDVELLRALIGIHAPTSAAADQIRALAGNGPALLRAATEFARVVQGEKS